MTELAQVPVTALKGVGDALAENGGEILKFIGDGVMAYFPAEDALFLPVVTGQAIAAARRLIGDVEAANEARAAAGGHEPLRFGIGLHVGPVTFGNVGTNDRLDFTVIGPAVNRASRLEGMTKALGVHTDLTGSAAGVYGFSQMAVGGLCTLGASLGNNPALSAFTVLTLACIVGQLGFRSALRVKTA